MILCTFCGIRSGDQDYHGLPCCHECLATLEHTDCKKCPSKETCERVERGTQ
jgi:hypothetical protein